MKRLNKKGFSIVEVIIAMAVIAIVSASALTIVLNSFNNTKAAMYKADAQYLVYDALECFKATDSWEEFNKAFVFCRDENLIPPASPVNDDGDAGDSVEPTEDENKLPTGTTVRLMYLLNDSQYSVLVTLVYGEPVAKNINSQEEEASSIVMPYSYDKFTIQVMNSVGEEIAAINDYSRISSDNTMGG